MSRAARPSDSEIATWRAFLRLHRRLVERLDHELRERHDLPLEWYDVLLQISEAGGRMRMGALADAVLISAPNCTRLVDRMEVVGLVERVVDPDDARARLAALTPKGRAKLRRAAPTHLEGIATHLTRHLDDDTRVALDELLARVEDGLDH